MLSDWISFVSISQKQPQWTAKLSTFFEEKRLKRERKKHYNICSWTAFRSQLKDWSGGIAGANTPHSMSSLHTTQEAPSLLGCKAVYFFCLLGLDEVYIRASGQTHAYCSGLGSAYIDIPHSHPQKKKKKKNNKISYYINIKSKAK